MQKYPNQTQLLVAVDCIILGFDGNDIKLLLIKRSFEPERNKFSLMGGFLQPDETLDEAANRILKHLTGLEGVYMEQLQTFSKPSRDPVERTISVAYFALIDIHQYEQQINEAYDAEWFLQDNMPKLIFDHEEMVELAKKKLKYKAALHPILFELLPDKFTIPQLQTLYEAIFQKNFDSRNFSRKLLSSGLLIKLNEKDKLNSKKGAFYYKVDQEKYLENESSFIKFVPQPEKLIEI
jgi:8-oxo-dGTP diphosphatase